MSKFRVSIAATLLISGIAYLIFASSSVEGIVYKTAAEIREEASSTRNYRMMGRAVLGSIERDPARRILRFRVRDQNGGEMTAVYSGIVPDAFRDSAEVVISGRYSARDDRFAADELQAKCPSKYQGGFRPEKGAQNSSS